jgi:RNA polymerase sigma-70 factor (ECF subfamily)
MEHYKEEVLIMHQTDSVTDESLDKLFLCLEELRPLEKAIMVMTLDGCSNKEISEVTGLTVTNVSTRKQRTILKLKSCFNGKN